MKRVPMIMGTVYMPVEKALSISFLEDHISARSGSILLEINNIDLA